MMKRVKNKEELEAHRLETQLLNCLKTSCTQTYSMLGVMTLAKQLTVHKSY